MQLFLSALRYHVTEKVHFNQPTVIVLPLPFSHSNAKTGNINITFFIKIIFFLGLPDPTTQLRQKIIPGPLKTPPEIAATNV